MLPLQSEIRFLASVRSVSEALHAASQGADIIDCKEPHAGALGALDCATIAEVRRVVPAGIPVSATVGDDAVTATDLIDRVSSRAAVGVDFVKIGFDSRSPWQDAVSALSGVEFGSCHLVAVLLADCGIDLAMIETCAKAGFAGVLLDTSDKNAGALPDVVTKSALCTFVQTAHDHDLFAGLAGALRAHHVTELAALNPDILGFRGALCHDNGRQNELDPAAVAKMRGVIDATQTATLMSVKSLEVSPL